LRRRQSFVFSWTAPVAAGSGRGYIGLEHSSSLSYRLHPFTSPPIDASCPSGHMAFVATLVLALILISRGRSFRPLIVVLGAFVVAFVAFVAFAPVIDDVRYPSDVVASIVCSVGLAPLVLHL
jgi:membrane-associated phospholipid phosphatase